MISGICLSEDSLNGAIDLESDLIESLDFSSMEIKKIFYKYIKTTQVNDLILTSSKFINKLGFNNRLKSIIKNVNSDANTHLN